MTFKGVSNINRPDISENIRDNIITYIDYNLLAKGGYYNVNIPTSGAYGGNAHILRPVEDPRYTNGQVWEGFRGNWVWESGITPEPVQISGVFVDNSFQVKGSGHYVDYPNGRVVFDTAIATTSTVHLAYSFKWVKVTDSRRVPFFQQLQTNSFRVDNSNFLTGSGIYSLFAESRLQLPLIAIEMPVSTNKEAYELGSANTWYTSEILLHVVGEDDSIVGRLADVLDKQEENVEYMFDSYLLGTNNAFPLDYRGEKNSNPLTYPNLTAATGDGGYRYTSGVGEGKMRISDSSMSNGTWFSNNLYLKTVRWSIESILLYG